MWLVVGFPCRNGRLHCVVSFEAALCAAKTSTTNGPSVGKPLSGNSDLCATCLGRRQPGTQMPAVPACHDWPMA